MSSRAKTSARHFGAEGGQELPPRPSSRRLSVEAMETPEVAREGEREAVRGS